MADAAYRRVHMVINPASGKDEPILNVLIDTFIAAAARALNLRIAAAQRYHRQARSVSVTVEPDQPVWADGEHIGRTPLSVDVLQGVLTVVVP